MFNFGILHTAWMQENLWELFLQDPNNPSFFWCGFYDQGFYTGFKGVVCFPEDKTRFDKIMETLSHV